MTKERKKVLFIVVHFLIAIVLFGFFLPPLISGGNLGVFLGTFLLLFYVLYWILYLTKDKTKKEVK